MLTILNTVVPFFGLILAGYVAARMQWLPTAAVPSLNAFVLYFALPCMLFRFAAGVPFSELANMGVFATFALCGAAIVLLTAWGAMHLFRMRLREAAFVGYAASFSNSGYLGFPLIVALLGERAAAVVIASNAADLLITTTVVLALAQADGIRSRGLGPVVRDALRVIRNNPLLWSYLLGGLFSYYSLTLVTPVDNLIKLLANAAGPCALFTIGASLVRKNETVVRPEIAYTAVAKLIFHPLLVGLVAHFVFRVDAFATMVSVLIAALPTAGNVFIFAERYQGGSARISPIILVTTTAAFITFSLLVWAFGIHPPG